ncbi:MAG: hypothetical protein ACLPZM_07445 [Thermoplasmata archaeon]
MDPRDRPSGRKIAAIALTVGVVVVLVVLVVTLVVAYHPDYAATGGPSNVTGVIWSFNTCWYWTSQTGPGWVESDTPFTVSIHLSGPADG